MATYLITEAQIALFKKVVGAAEGFHFIADRAMIIEADTVLQSLPMVDNKPYAYMNPDDLCADTAFRWCKLDEFTSPVFTSPQALTPITADDVTDEMLYSAQVPYNNATYITKAIIAESYNAVIKHKVTK